MNKLVAIKAGLALLFTTSIILLVALIGAQAGNPKTVAPGPQATAQQAAAQQAAAQQAAAQGASRSLTISGAMARISFGRAVNSAGFLTICNHGDQADMCLQQYRKNE